MLIVFFSDIPWRDLHQRPQHIALAFSKEWKVLWVEPTTLLKKTHLRPTEVAPNIHVLSIPAIPYNARFRFVQAIAKPLSRVAFLRSLLTSVQTSLVRGGIRQIAGKGEPVGVFVNNFHCVDVAEKLRPAFIQFDYIDNAFGFTAMPEHVKESWKKMIRIATFTTVTSMKLAALIRPVRQTDIHFAGNGVEYSFFAEPGDAARPADLPEGKPIVCYTGAIYPWLDYALIRSLTHSMPDVNFVFIGPAHPNILPVLEEMKGGGNFFHLGFKPYATLPAYLKHVDAGIIPFRKTELTASVNPVKLYEYCAAGKPTVATRFAEELLSLKDEVRFADSPEEFSASLRGALADSRDSAFVERLRRFAREHDWHIITSSIIGLIKRYTPTLK